MDGEGRGANHYQNIIYIDVFPFEAFLVGPKSQFESIVTQLG